MAISLFRPWVGVVAMYLFALLVPQAIWWWVFQDLRPVFYISITTILGFLLALLSGKISFRSLSNKRLVCILVLWLTFIVSYFFGDYVHVSSPFRFSDPDQVFSTVNKIFILFFLCCLCIDTKKKLQYLVMMFVIATLFLIYWSNDQYFVQGQFGRIGGPAPLGGASIYQDENNFAMLFVTGLPLLYYAGFYCKKYFFNYLFWLAIPLGWHAIFLAGSRGGLVGLIVTLIVIVARTKQKIFAVLGVIFFIFFFAWQAGDVMRGRTQTITTFEEDESAMGRIYSWQAAVKMAIDHPFTGVGFASFGPAYPYYSDARPREAHNTFFQILAESGVLSGIMYLFAILLSYKSLLKTRKRGSELKDKFHYLLNEALTASFSGLVVCSLFLSLQYFEIFYYIYALIHINTVLAKNKLGSSRKRVPGSMEVIQASDEVYSRTTVKKL